MLRQHRFFLRIPQLRLPFLVHQMHGCPPRLLSHNHKFLLPLLQTLPLFQPCLRFLPTLIHLSLR
jgi:hypothetical protein